MSKVPRLYILACAAGMVVAVVGGLGGASGQVSATPTPAGLYQSLGAFPVEPTPTPGLLTILGDSAALPTLADGDRVSGSLSADQPEAAYELPVRAGDFVALGWMGAFAPSLRVLDAGGEVIVGAMSGEPVPDLALTFRAPATETLRLVVSSSRTGSTGGEFSLTVAIEPGSALPPAPAVTPLPAAVPATEAPELPGGAVQADYLDAPCTSGQPGESGQISGVYTASGDSFTPEELTPTGTFATDDDLNAVFDVQTAAETVQVAGVFCAPDGAWFDAGEESYATGGPYLLGLDWEYLSLPWTPGNWTVEIYVDGTLDIVLALEVAE